MLRARISSKECPLWIFTAAMLVLISVPIASAQVTSENHPTLERALKAYPKADTDQNGILTLEEYQAFQKALKPGNRPKADQPAILPLLSNGNVLITDFEEANFGQMRQWGWTIEGDAFSRDLPQATQLMKRRALAFSGRHFLSSYPGSDAATGKVVSPLFEIDLRFIELLLSGGSHSHRVCVNLVIDGKVLRTATGRNRDQLELVAFDVLDLQGQKARLEIVDAHRGIWGHLNVDRILQTNQASARRIVRKAPTGYGKVSVALRTTDHHYQGALSLEDGKLKVGDQPVKIDSILQAICNTDTAPPKASGALRLIDGQVWYGQVLNLNEGKVGIQSPVFGRREVPLEDIASIELKSGKTHGGKPGTLYRDQGEPIPGKLVWIRQKDVAIDCALGVLPVPRPTIQRVVLAKVSSQAVSQDEVALTNGNLLRGRLTLKENELILDQGPLGRVNLQWESVHYFRRARNGILWLDQTAAKVLERVGPALPPPEPSIVKSIDPRFLRAIRLMPRTVVEYSIPNGKMPRSLRGSISPVPKCRATLQARIKAGDKVLWEKQISPGSGSLPIEVDLPPVTKITLEVATVGAIAFPCGIDGQDLHIMAKEQ